MYALWISPFPMSHWAYCEFRRSLSPIERVRPAKRLAPIGRIAPIGSSLTHSPSLSVSISLSLVAPNVYSWYLPKQTSRRPLLEGAPAPTEFYVCSRRTAMGIYTRYWSILPAAVWNGQLSRSFLWRGFRTGLEVLVTIVLEQIQTYVQKCMYTLIPTPWQSSVHRRWSFKDGDGELSGQLVCRWCGPFTFIGVLSRYMWLPRGRCLPATCQPTQSSATNTSPLEARRKASFWADHTYSAAMLCLRVVISLCDKITQRILPRTTRNEGDTFTFRDLIVPGEAQTKLAAPWEWLYRWHMCRGISVGQTSETNLQKAKRGIGSDRRNRSNPFHHFSVRGTVFRHVLRRQRGSSLVF